MPVIAEDSRQFDMPDPSIVSRRRRLHTDPAPLQVLVAMVIGAALGLTAPGVAVAMKPLGDIFLNLIRMADRTGDLPDRDHRRLQHRQYASRRTGWRNRITLLRGSLQPSRWRSVWCSPTSCVREAACMPSVTGGTPVEVAALRQSGAGATRRRRLFPRHRA